MNKKQSVFTYLKEILANHEFINKHKCKPTDFTRERVLKFITVFLLILRNSVKSIQLVLNELFLQGVICSTVSASAYVQARKKFRHTAFIELNESLMAIYYSDDKIKKWKGFRCLSVDGSKIILPNTSEMKKEFGEIKIKNQEVESSYACALFVCCYDVLNRIAVKNILASGLAYEVNLASSLLDVATSKDLLIYDRGYTSYRFLATLIKNNKNYLIRCSANSFKAATSLFKEETWSKEVYLKAPQDQRKELQSQGLSLEIKVRFVSVKLSTGEIEVLITSIVDDHFKRNDFKELYHLRWGVESYFNLIKGRLNIENFTGKTVESVKQDFWSSIFISTLETIFTEKAEEEINASSKENKYEKKINKAVSFNTIKNTVFELLLNENDKNDLFQKMELAFKTNPVLKRMDRSPPRKKFSALRSYNFVRRMKKQVF